MDLTQILTLHDILKPTYLYIRHICHRRNGLEPRTMMPNQTYIA